MKLLMAFLVSLGILDLAEGAVQISNLDASSYGSVMSTSTVSAKAEMVTGFSSSSSMEVTLTTNSTLAFSHVWSMPEDVRFLYDAAGNASIRTGSSFREGQPLGGVNALIIKLDDSAPGSFATEFKNITINGVPVRNLFASDGTDYVMITNFGSTVDLKGAFYKNVASAGNESRLTFFAVSIPEPSSSLMCLLSISATLLRRRRY